MITEKLHSIQLKLYSANSQPRLSEYDNTSLAHPFFRQFLPFFFVEPFELRLDRKGWGKDIFRSFQRRSIGFRSRLWLGRDSFVIVTVRRVAVLLEDEPSPQTRVQSALEHITIQDIYVHCYNYLAFKSD